MRINRPEINQKLFYSGKYVCHKQAVQTSIHLPILFTGAAIAGSGSISSTATAVATAETAISGSGVLTASAAVMVRGKSGR